MFFSWYKIFQQGFFILRADADVWSFDIANQLNYFSPIGNFQFACYVIAKPLCIKSVFCSNWWREDTYSLIDKTVSVNNCKDLATTITVKREDGFLLLYGNCSMEIPIWRQFVVTIFLYLFKALNDQGLDTAYSACLRAIENIGYEYLDLYLIHWPGAAQLKREDQCCNQLEEWWSEYKIYSTKLSSKILCIRTWPRKNNACIVPLVNVFCIIIAPVK